MTRRRRGAAERPTGTGSSIEYPYREVNAPTGKRWPTGRRVIKVRHCSSALCHTLLSTSRFPPCFAPPPSPVDGDPTNGRRGRCACAVERRIDTGHAGVCAWISRPRHETRSCRYRGGRVAPQIRISTWRYICDGNWKSASERCVRCNHDPALRATRPALSTIFCVDF